MIQKELQNIASKQKAKILSRFFKTGKGQYGEGDIFLGISVPDQRKVAKKYVGRMSLSDVETLLRSDIHEYRFTALLILEELCNKGDWSVCEVCMRNVRWINNWDLVDSSAHYIVGAYLDGKDKSVLDKMARSHSLWERRIAIMATFYFIKNNQFTATLKLSKQLLGDQEDLIHKAVGWMLREIGKRDLATEVAFLSRHYQAMPRTMLRYAIEKFSEAERQRYLNGEV